jgi:hypothetical protein
MLRRLEVPLILAAAILLGGAQLSYAETTPAAKTLERLRSLAGTWEGTLEWSGARTGSGTLRASYRVGSGKSVVIEELMMGSDDAPSMISMYHLDGSDLRVTHYCAAQNQPRLQATRIDENGADFSFVDATDLTAHPAHVEGLELRFLADDRVVVNFRFDAGGKKSVEHIELHRTRR